MTQIYIRGSNYLGRGRNEEELLRKISVFGVEGKGGRRRLRCPPFVIEFIFPLTTFVYFIRDFNINHEYHHQNNLIETGPV